MPSVEHAAIVELVRSHPEVVPPLLGKLGVSLPPFDRVTVQEPVLDQVTPTELRADLVLELGSAEVPSLAVVLEVQRQIDPDKPYVWPAYLATYRARRRIDTMVLVLTKSLEVVAWARRAVRLGPGNDAFRIHVVGPAEMPTIDDPITAVEQNALAVLALMTHGNVRGNRQAGLAAIRKLLQRLDIPEWEIYLQIIRDTAERDFEKEIELMLRERDPDMKFFPALQDLVDRSEAKGEARGEARGERKALYMFLAQRGIDLTAEQRAALDSCTDSAQIEQWIKRAATATSAADLFE